MFGTQVSGTFRMSREANYSASFAVLVSGAAVYTIPDGPPSLSSTACFKSTDCVGAVPLARVVVGVAVVSHGRDALRDVRLGVVRSRGGA